MKKILGFTICMVIASNLFSQNILSLDSCRYMAIKFNKSLKIHNEKIVAAHYDNKASFTNFLPKISAMGTYMRTQKEISLLNDEQKTNLPLIGSSTQVKLQETIQQLVTANPGLAQLLSPLSPLIPEIGNSLNNIGAGLVDALHTDTKNMFAGAITLTQPIYMGGKIAAYNKITKYAEEIAKTEHNRALEELILSTDQAYWQVISVINKKKLAESYLNLVKKLEDDIKKMIAEGVATTTDGLSVSVKVNEAEMKLLQAEDGVILSKMVLCQLCGLPIDSDITLADEDIQDISISSIPEEGIVQTAMNNRPEIKSLEYASKIYNQKINVSRAELLPSLALTGNYLISNPSLYNGFERKFRGNWAVGAVINIPIWSWGEGFYKMKSAKAEANIAKYNLEEAKEKIELQVNQAKFKIKEAEKRYFLSKKNLEKADENLRYANLSFKEGVIPTSNVLEAQTAWLMAQSNKIDSQIDIILSEVYLRKTLGILK